MSKTTALKPRLSEKSYGLSQTNNTYVFEVESGANKHTVARAVAEQFEVEVTNVNITNVKGKNKRVITKGGRRVSRGDRPDVRKAYVTLAEGNHLPIFAAEEEAAAKAAEEAAKADKKAAKKEGKK